MAVDLVAGDRTKIVRTCKNSDGTVQDLTGWSAKLHYRIDGGALNSPAMSIQSPATAGKVEYEMGAGELAAGEMKGAVELIDASGKIYSQLNPFTRRIRAKL